MTPLSHGSDLRLAPTLGVLVRAGLSTVRSALDAVVAAGCQAVQLDATLPGIRPRELDRRARQDLVALFARRGVQVAGWDLFIPRAHFLDSAELDRAVTATLAAIELCADCGRLPLSLPLPLDRMDADAAGAIVQAADGRGVALALHGEDRLAKLAAAVEAIDQPVVGLALDPAALLALGRDPADAVHRLAKRLLVARLSDAPLHDATDEDGGSNEGRRTVGEGDLDIEGYRVAVDLAPRRRGRWCWICGRWHRPAPP